MTRSACCSRSLITPIHELFFLIPRFETLHTHSDYRIIGALLLGPPMLGRGDRGRHASGASSLATGRDGIVPALFLPHGPWLSGSA